MVVRADSVSVSAAALTIAGNMSDNAPEFGKIPFALGQASVVRIPVPGTNGLCLELRPRGKVPAGGSTSTIFIQDAAGKRHLRLDYGYNKTTQTVDFHWNQKGTHSNFGITDHKTAGRAGAAAYRAAKYFRYAGRVLLVAGALIDAISIVQANNRLRRSSEVVTGWAAGWIGCKTVGAIGAGAGTAATPGLGSVAGGFLGCVIGGIGGYAAGSSLGGQVYDWAEGTLFVPLQEVNGP
jgi:hypothetical protein